MKGWLSFIAALIFFAASALNFFNAGFNSANGASGVATHIGLGIVWLSLGGFWLTQAQAHLPNYSLKRTDQSLRD